MWARQIHPPRAGSDGKDWDVDGLMARETGRLRAIVQASRARGCQAQVEQFKRAYIKQHGALKVPGPSEVSVYHVE